jgi:hypothetical protein
VHVDSGDRGVALAITPAAAGIGGFFDTETGIPVDSLQFVDEALGGNTITPFVENGAIGYPDFPGIPAVVVGAHEFLRLNRTMDMFIRRAVLEPTHPALEVALEGTLVEGAVGSPDSAVRDGSAKGRWRDARLTLLQSIRHGPGWQIVAVVAAWALSTTWSGYEIWKNLAK